MRLADYASYDALGLADLVRHKQVSPQELAHTAAAAIAAVNPGVNAVVKSYPDRIQGLDESSLGRSLPRRPFPDEGCLRARGRPQDRVRQPALPGDGRGRDTHLAQLLRAAGVNIIGRTNTPEYSMSGTTENAMNGNTSTPWRKGYSAGGSSGGAMAAVVSGIVPMAHGSDIAGSIRIPASFCGGLGFKPSRGRISFGPAMDENGYGLGMNFVQAKSVRDAAAMLDCLAIPQPGDPFVIPRPAEPYSAASRRAPPRLRIGWSTDALMGFETDPEVRDAVVKVAKTLADMGHDVAEESPRLDGEKAMSAMMDLWFYGFDLRLAAFSKRSRHPIAPGMLEPVVQLIYEHARSMRHEQFFAAIADINAARRSLGAFFTRNDVWLSPTTARVAEPWGLYHLGRTDVTYDEIVAKLKRVLCQFTLPHNITGTPAVSLPLVMHSSGLPIGIQLGARPAEDHVILQLAGALEQAMPWAARIPPLHVSKAAG